MAISSLHRLGEGSGTGQIANSVAPTIWKPHGFVAGRPQGHATITGCRLHAVPAEVSSTTASSRPDALSEEGEFTAYLNPKSRETLKSASGASLATASQGYRFQFVRLCYFSLDSKDSSKDSVFNGPQPARHLARSRKGKIS
jgi:hypothetical protein